MRLRIYTKCHFSSRYRMLFYKIQKYVTKLLIFQDRNGDSNLIHAARGGHKKVVEALLKKHADIDCVGKDKKTALYWAVEKGHTQVVKVSVK